MLTKKLLIPVWGAGSLLYQGVGFSELRNEQKRPAPLWVSLYFLLFIGQVGLLKNLFKNIIKAPD